MYYRTKENFKRFFSSLTPTLPNKKEFLKIASLLIDKEKIKVNLEQKEILLKLKELINEDCEVQELTDALDTKNIDKYVNEFVGIMCDPNNYMHCSYQVFDILGFSPGRIHVPNGPRVEENIKSVR